MFVVMLCGNTVHGVDVGLKGFFYFLCWDEVAVRGRKEDEEGAFRLISAQGKEPAPKPFGFCSGDVSRNPPLHGRFLLMNIMVTVA
jgi:hypothetical protein